MSGNVAAVLRAFDDGRARAELYRMWRIGCAAGLTPAATLEKAGHFRGSTGALHAHLLGGLRARRDLATLTRMRPELFEPFEAALLTMGEEAGALEPVLGDLAAFFERQVRMMNAVKKHLTYPLFLSLVTIWLGPLPLAFGGETRTYAVTVLCGTLLWFFLGGTVLAGFARSYQRRPAFVRARLARTLSLTIGAGLALPRAVRLAAAASDDEALLRHVGRFDERTLGTQSLEATLAGVPVVTPDFLGALKVAEATGDFRTTLGRLAELYEDGFR